MHNRHASVASLRRLFAFTGTPFGFPLESPFTFTGIPSHLTDLAKQFRTARAKAGLAKDLVLYCSRHDYGTRVLNNTGNLAAVMKTMGHRDVRTAMQYQHPELEMVRGALNRANGSALQTSV